MRRGDCEDHRFSDYRAAIDLAWPNEQQILTLLDSNTPYVALTRGGRYEAMLQREAVEQAIIRELFSQYQQRG